MRLKTRLLFGPLVAVILATGLIVLPLFIPGYDHVRQTVSEIGEVGSPMRVPFAIMLCSVAIGVLVLAFAVRDFSRALGYSLLPAYLIGAMAVSAAGVALFAHPHPLHNVFGLSELVGYQAPLALALTWRRQPQARLIVTVSWVMYILIVVAIVLNLSAPLGLDAVWTYVQARYGVAQRVLFGAWFGWAAIVGALLSSARYNRTPGVGRTRAEQ
ncbi:MAG: DUF998 domain-containing protein [Gemmatimonadaceae bacterium]|nr:DUF998 domain-containing protein [Gemmatimonadaceae bacterium]